MSTEENVKDILDRECWEKWKEKNCVQRHKAAVETKCWCCDKNIPLAQELLDAVKEKI